MAFRLRRMIVLAASESAIPTASVVRERGLRTPARTNQSEMRFAKTRCFLPRRSWALESLYMWFNEPPNESRLSCGAKLKYSQMEFYHTARRTFAGLIEEGRRQLQALVRQHGLVIPIVPCRKQAEFLQARRSFVTPSLEKTRRRCHASGERGTPRRLSVPRSCSSP